LPKTKTKYRQLKDLVDAAEIETVDVYGETWTHFNDGTWRSFDESISCTLYRHTDWDDAYIVPVRFIGNDGRCYGQHLKIRLKNGPFSENNDEAISIVKTIIDAHREEKVVGETENIDSCTSSQ